MRGLRKEALRSRRPTSHGDFFLHLQSIVGKTAAVLAKEREGTSLRKCSVLIYGPKRPAVAVLKNRENLTKQDSVFLSTRYSFGVSDYVLDCVLYKRINFSVFSCEQRDLLWCYI